MMAAANNPQNIPCQSIFTSILMRFVAKTVPIKTIKVAIIFLAFGNFLVIKPSTTTLNQTDCINKTIAIDTLIYWTLI